MFDQKPDFYPAVEQQSVDQAGVLPDSLATPGLNFSGVLTFVLADMTVFALLFFAFLVDRAGSAEMFALGSTSLDIQLGLLNTVILIVSGVFMVRAVNAAKEADLKRVRRNLVMAVLVGSAFGISKLVEYSAKFDQGISITTNDFYMYYFALTGAHFLHFLGGVGAILVLITGGSRQAAGKAYFGHVESVGIYWHMVDLLWLVIFPLLYLLV